MTMSRKQQEIKIHILFLEPKASTELSNKYTIILFRHDITWFCPHAFQQFWNSLTTIIVLSSLLTTAAKGATTGCRHGTIDATGTVATIAGVTTFTTASTYYRTEASSLTKNILRLVNLDGLSWN